VTIEQGSVVLADRRGIALDMNPVIVRGDLGRLSRRVVRRGGTHIAGARGHGRNQAGQERSGSRE